MVLCYADELFSFQNDSLKSSADLVNKHGWWKKKLSASCEILQEINGHVFLVELKCMLPASMLSSKMT